MSGLSICDKIDNHNKAMSVINNNDVMDIIQTAFKNAGELSTIHDVDIGFSDVSFLSNGDVLLTFEDVVIESSFDGVSYDNTFDSLSITISQNNVIGNW